VISPPKQNESFVQRKKKSLAQHSFSVTSFTLGFRLFFNLLQINFGLKYGNIVLTTTTGHRVRYHLCLLLLVRPAGYIVNLSDFYSYSLIGKLTAFLQFQEFSFRKPTVTSSTSDARLSLNSSRTKLVCLSLRQHLYVLILT
jgi:hypothetical protein